MARFAKINENNIVEEVHEISDSIAITEEAGINFLKQLLGSDTNWKQSSMNGTRKNIPNTGYTYDVSRDAFIQPKPHDSWVLNEDTCQWEATVERPDDGKRYVWNEDTKSWDEID
jgi:hypothetical protein